jgi:hypothetical protein
MSEVTQSAYEIPHPVGDARQFEQVLRIGRLSGSQTLQRFSGIAPAISLFVGENELPK